MIPTLNAVTAGGGLPLPEYVQLAAQNGFKGADISIEAAQSLGLEAARDLFASNGVVPASFGLSVEWRKDEETFQNGLKALPTQAQFAQQLGLSRVCTWVLPSSGEDKEVYAARSIARFVEIARILGDSGVHLGLEFLGPQHFRPEAEKVWFYDINGALHVADEVNEKAGTNNVGLLIDCWHWYTGGGTLMDLAACPVEQVVHVHINDSPKGIAVADVQDWVRELPGATGEIDITGFLTTLKNLGYTGPVAVETFSQALKEMAHGEAAKLAGESVKKVFTDAGLPF